MMIRVITPCVRQFHCFAYGMSVTSRTYGCVVPNSNFKHSYGLHISEAKPQIFIKSDVQCNKAGYTTTDDACGLAGAMIKKRLTKHLGRSSNAETAHKSQKH